MEGRIDVSCSLWGANAVSRDAQAERAMPLCPQQHSSCGPGRGAKPQSQEALTRREREVFSLLTLRLTDPEIAGHLVISTRTVESHVASILSKLGAANRREAIALPGHDERASIARSITTWPRLAARLAA